MKNWKLFLLLSFLSVMLCACSHSEDAVSNHDPSSNEASSVFSDDATLYHKSKLADTVIVEFKDEDDKVWLNQDDIEMVYAKYSDMNSYYIEFKFTENGSAKFAAFTKENVGKTINICVNDEVISSAMVPEEIAGDRVNLSNFQSRDKMMELYKKLAEGVTSQ